MKDLDDFLKLFFLSFGISFGVWLVIMFALWINEMNFNTQDASSLVLGVLWSICFLHLAIKHRIDEDKRK